MIAVQGLFLIEGWQRLRTLQRSLDSALELSLPAFGYAQGMQSAAQQRLVYLLRMMAEPDPLQRDDDMLAFEAAGHVFGRERDALLSLALSAAQRQQVHEVMAQAVDLSKLQRPIVAALVGGDEFAVLLYDTADEERLTAAEHVRRALDDFAFRWEGRIFKLSASIGTVDFDARADVTAFARVMAAADAACYEAKRAGRNAVHRGRES